MLFRLEALQHSYEVIDVALILNDFVLALVVLKDDLEVHAVLVLFLYVDSLHSLQQRVLKAVRQFPLLLLG